MKVLSLLVLAVSFFSALPASAVWNCNSIGATVLEVRPEFLSFAVGRTVFTYVSDGFSYVPLSGADYRGLIRLDLLRRAGGKLSFAATMRGEGEARLVECRE